jgi:predicted O-methyltransferase YrrM
VLVDLDYDVKPAPRWGYGKPAHPQLRELIDAGRARYAARLQGLLAFSAALARIPREQSAPSEPAWTNPWFTGLDGMALYGLIRAEQPATYLEVGSGTSTKFARRAVLDGRLQTRITSIDPAPRAEVDAICDRVIRKPLEDIGLEAIDELQPGDVLFMDGSHRVLTNSDTVVFFLEILPRLKPGVFVHVHDVFLPYDYPSEWNNRFYSEQYLLAAWLLGGSAGVRIELPNAFITQDAELKDILKPIWSDELPDMSHIGGSFWMRKT